MRQDQKISLSRTLRKNNTKAESILWHHLRNRRLNGRKFRRQHAIGRFIVDFCCLDLLLVIEIDGGVHCLRERSDAEREAHLVAQGYMVVRFTNGDVLDNLGGVLDTLWNLTKTDDPERPSP